MGRSNTPKYRASNISSAANLASSSISPRANKSSILKSSFSSPHFQPSLFASVIQGLDSQHLRIHDTNTGRIRCDYALESRTSITCLSWGEHDGEYENRQRAIKKRKRDSEANGSTAGEWSTDSVVAFGTTDSDIYLYSPAAAKVVCTLKNGHTLGIRDFQFISDGEHGDGWSIGGDARAVQWHVKTGQRLRTVPLPFGPASTICLSRSSLICASHIAYFLDLDSKRSPVQYNAAIHSVHSIVNRPRILSSRRSFLTAAENDHSLSVFEEGLPTLIGSLRAENEVVHVNYHHVEDDLKPLENRALSDCLILPKEAIIVINKEGVLELFPEPFDFGGHESQKISETMKARIQKRSRKSTAQIKVMRPGKVESVIPLINASFRSDRILMAWTEGGVNVHFDTMQWRNSDSGSILLKGESRIYKERSIANTGLVAVNGVKDIDKSHVDESHTVVANPGGAEKISFDHQQPEVIDISSDEEESEDSDEENGSGPQPSTAATTVSDDRKEKPDSDVEMEGAERPREQATSGKQSDRMEEPSFGELIRANATETIDVHHSLAEPSAQNLVPSMEKSLQLPSGMSFGTVLTQSLRTNDKNLLESCFHVKDLNIVRATIERLDSLFASTLLERLAERLHNRPGRAGSLMVWIQWTLISHGGYLAGQKDLMKKLVSLHNVVQERANSLQSLLALKGKLDMLEAQMNLRRSMQARSRVEDEEDEEAVIYVEGQDESDSEQDQGEAGEKMTASPYLNGREVDGSDADSGRDMPMVNGDTVDSEEEASGSEEDMFDDEASSTEQDSGDESVSEKTDHDDIDNDSSDADTSPPPKRSAKALGPNRKR